MEQQNDNKKLWLLILSWLVSLMALLGSLYFSEIRHFPPCVLCWYQRICMYPLTIILAVGIINKDKLLHRYVLPLAGIGFLIGVYHNLLYYKILPEAAAPCIAGVSCTTKYIAYFGFITIPLLSTLAFLAVFILMWIFKRTK